jgi:hypothetical protein
MNSFVEQTARDYDLPVHIVEKYYKRYKGTNKFYEQLEEELGSSSNNKYTATPEPTPKSSKA